MHQPIVEPMPFRRSSFGVDSSLRTAPVTSDAAQAFKEMLSRPDRPVPSRRSSLRGAPQTFAPPPPPPPPASMATQVVDPTTLSAMLESTLATPICPSSPSVDMTHPSTPHRVHLSPARSPPSTSPPPRGSFSQADHLLRSNPGFVPPPSASRRAFSFVRDHPVRPPMAGYAPSLTPERTSSCPPDADVLKTRAMRSNSDGYTSASTSFMTECSGSPTSSISSQPSDSEDTIGGQTHSSHDTKKAPKHCGPSFNLELESRRLDLLWRETEKLWKDKHGNTLSRAEDMAFRQKVEGGLGHSEDSSPESEWRELWGSTNNKWSEFEARWQQENGQKRAASRNDDGHFHTAHSESRDMTSTDDDKTMNTIMAAFEQRMNEKRRSKAAKRAEEEKRREQERTGGWPGTLLTPEIDPLHRSHERLLRPDVMRTRSSSVVVEGRPVFHRARSGSIAAPTDAIPTVVASNAAPESTSFETAPRPIEKPIRGKRGRHSHGSREGFDFMQHEDESQRTPTYAEQHRAGEVKQGYMSQARSQFRREDAQPAGDSRHEEISRTDHPRRRESERRSRELSETAAELHRPRDESSRPREASSGEVRLPRVRSTDHVSQPPKSIEEEVLKLEREQQELARRIQELRAAAAAAAVHSETTPAPHELDRGRERERDQKSSVSEPKAKNDARKQQNNEADAFKAMQERMRKAEEQNKSTEFVRKAKRAATTSFLETETTPIASPESRLAQAVPGDSELSETRVHFSPEIPTAEQQRPSIPRVRTPGPRAPSRARTPSPRSQSPVGHSSASSISIASSNATRDTSPGHEAASSVHEVVMPVAAPKPQPSPTAPRPPVSRARDSGSGLPLNPDRPKSTVPTSGPGLVAPPHVNISTSPVDGSHEQEASPMNAKTPRASAFDPERTPRAPVCPVPEPNPKAEPSPPPRVYVSPNQARARAEEETSKRRGEEDPIKRRADDDITKRRIDAAMGATVAAAAAEAFDRAGGKKRGKDAEFQAQEERRAAEEHLARERRRQEEERRRQDEDRRRQEDERRARERAEEARLREAAEKRDREERARMERERRERQEQEERKQRRWAETQQYERARPPLRSETSIVDAWNSYELRWSALSVASSTQPITFRNIPWPLLHAPSGPESITPQAVGAFLLSPLHSQDKSRKERLRTAMLRWHSDKFEGRYVSRIDESERDKVKEAVGAVARSLTELMTKPDLY